MEGEQRSTLEMENVRSISLESPMKLNKTCTLQSWGLKIGQQCTD